MRCNLPKRPKLPCVCLCHVVHAAAFVLVLALALAVAPDPVCCFKGGGLQGGEARIVRRRRRKENGDWGAAGALPGCWGPEIPYPSIPCSRLPGTQRMHSTYSRRLGRCLPRYVGRQRRLCRTLACRSGHRGRTYENDVAQATGTETSTETRHSSIVAWPCSRLGKKHLPSGLGALLLIGRRL